MSHRRPPVSEIKKRGTATAPLDRILKSRRTIFVLLFFVTGLLGLPLLWKSPVFSRFEKIAWTAITTLYTSAMITLCVVIWWRVYDQIMGN